MKLLAAFAVFYVVFLVARWALRRIVGRPADGAVAADGAGAMAGPPVGVAGSPTGSAA